MKLSSVKSLLNKEIKILGVSLNISNIIIISIIWSLISCLTFASCLEDVSTLHNNLTNSVFRENYENNNDISETYTLNSSPKMENSLFLFNKNKFKGSCCETSFASSSNGCPCITQEQNDVLNTRGGNNPY